MSGSYKFYFLVWPQLANKMELKYRASAKGALAKGDHFFYGDQFIVPGFLRDQFIVLAFLI